jgi:hypothetical protein
MHKTGTTAMQSLFAASRERLRDFGVVYPGEGLDHHRAAKAFIQRALGPGGIEPPPLPEVWQELVAEVHRESASRVVLSSEFFSLARGNDPARLARDLGGRANVLVGVRNTTQSATSAWQQTLKQKRLSDIDAWARRVIPRKGRPVKESGFMAQWDLGAVVRRWCDAFGPENVTVVVVDRADRKRLPMTFESMLDLPAGFLADQEPPVSNRGMTAYEAELLRRLNAACRDMEWRTYKRVIRKGVAEHVVESYDAKPDEPRPVLPKWAQEELQAAGLRFADEIRATGVRVIGQLEALSAPPLVVPRPVIDSVPVDVAVHAVVGGVLADLEIRRPLEQITSRELLAVVWRRVKRRMAHTAHAVLHRPDAAGIP